LLGEVDLGTSTPAWADAAGGSAEVQGELPVLRVSR
jgi:hypothetical protein